MYRSTAFRMFTGRIGQRDYVIWVSLLMGIRFAAAIAIAFKPDWHSALGATDFFMVLVAGVAGRRLRDFDWSALWAWALIAMTSVFLPVIAIIYFGHPGSASVLDALPPWLGWISTGVLLAFLVVVGRTPGDAGANRYGQPAEPEFPRKT